MAGIGRWTAVCVMALALACASAAADDGERVRAWEGTITLPTYPWEPEDVNPHFPELGGRIIYPYTMQDNLSSKKVDRTYRALFLENEYLKVTCLPELGGRIHSVFDKTSNEEMFHLNRVIKPGLIAMRGAWISGGIEWNPGPHGHTVTIVSPVDARLMEGDDGSASLVVANTDKILGTRWTVELTLRPGRAYLDERIRIVNPTDGMHPYYFWNNTAFPCREGTRYIYPMSLGTDHNGREFFNWPIHEGRDMTWLKNYEDMTSTFAYRCVYDFFGAYDVDADRGIVQYADHNILPGKKAWTWGQADFGLVSQESLTDEDGPYIEVQTGPLPTQSDYEFLAPRRQVAWREWWYPVHGLGDGFEYATADVAVQSYRNDGRLEFRVLATAEFSGAAVTVSQGERTLLQETRDLSPMSAQVFSLSPAPEGAVEFRAVSAGGAVLAAYTSPLPIPQETAPEFPAEKSEDEMTVEELYRKAVRFDKDTNRVDARAWYEKALERDPGHADSLRALAVLDIESGRYAAARDRLDEALKRAPDDGLTWCYRGIAALKLDDAEKAAECGYQAVRLPDWVGLGYDIVGRARMRQGRFDEARRAFQQAARHNPQDLRARDHALFAIYAAGDAAAARRRAEDRLERDPLALLPRALLVLARDGYESVVEEARRDLGEYEYEWLTTALDVADLGLMEAAAALLERVAPEPRDPLILYHRALWLQQSGRGDDEVDALLRQAAALSPDFVFPSHPQSLDALQFAIERNPRDARAWLYLGNLYGGLCRVDEAVPCWEKACAEEPGLSVAWRNRALHAWKKGEDLETAKALYAKAIDARPDDEVLYHDRATILIALGRRTEAIDLLASRPTGERPRADATLLHARALIDEKRYDDAIGLLDTADFSNWEGQTDSWDLFNRARVERGKLRLEAGELEAARADFAAALTYPKNLRVGRPVRPREAEAQYWLGRALDALGRPDEARDAWKAGADGIPSSDTQNRHIELCREALGASSG